MHAKLPNDIQFSKRILIFSEYVDNNGDLTFGCKLAANIASQYPNNKIDVCTIPKKRGKEACAKGMQLAKDEKLNDFNKNNSYPVKHLDDYIKDNKNKLDMVIVGPVVMPGCVQDILSLKKKIDFNTKILLISEYGFPQKSLEQIKELFTDQGFKNVSIQATGVTEGKGIFVNQEIKNFNKKDQGQVQTVSQTLGAVGKLLYGAADEANLSSYLSSHEVAMHYSHNNAEKVVGIHTRYVNSDKDTDLIVLGESAKNDKQALITNMEILKEKGFAKIVYVDAPNEPETLFDNGRDGSTYRIVHTGRVSLEQSIALRKISGEFSGATGDQSYSEALSRSPIVIYETQVWKRNFLEDQIALANQIDPSGQLGRTIQLMGSQDIKKNEYDELVDLLKQEFVKDGLQNFRKIATEDRCLQDKISEQIKDMTLVARNKKDEGFSFSKFKKDFMLLIGKENNGKKELVEDDEEVEDIRKFKMN
ncbi:hypothetical protein Lgra_0215 [Legionella gratiana]|uniref:Uncharacterized protein n=1 Tax=Legionella gratiana TaxID=45066 RepID=A0A378JCP6_9GAMM|nr:hypothetical protein [Legionella gratiana]KTD15549.1 hypothetical protein Lgra_0215 [Legionella gratiana]STX45106.1 Uncharacterised protein [Legionella gratiana]